MRSGVLENSEKYVLSQSQCQNKRQVHILQKKTKSNKKSSGSGKNLTDNLGWLSYQLHKTGKR